MITYVPWVDAGHRLGDDATVDVRTATVGHLVHAAQARGVDTSLPELLKAAGHSYAGVIEVLCKPSGRV